ncbi:hypothetical protein F4604DRAFT_1957370 [Suillus subluteus]|nr:hypothetical protein F4604DRAFT_1957370 [Suillus subluteus]
MGSKSSKVIDDSKESVSNAPPPYSTTSESTPAVSASTLQTCILDIVSAPDLTPFSVAPIVDACSTTFSAAEFSDFLQTLNIEGHTALYWAIVNERREAFTALLKFTPELSSVCSSDLRLACMITNDQALFAQLNLGDTNPKDGPLRRSLGCPPDDVQVHSGDGLGENHFVAHFRIRKFQKRIRIIRDLSVEFVAEGRIWSLKTSIWPDGKCRIGFNLSRHSFPVYPIGVIVIEAHEKPGCATPSPALQFRNSTPDILVPCWIKYDGGKDPVRIVYSWKMSTDWVMDDNTKYVDSDGTLHVKLEMTLK